MSEAESNGNRAIQQVALNVRQKQEAIEAINTHAQQQKQQIQANKILLRKKKHKPSKMLMKLSQLQYKILIVQIRMRM